MTAQREFSDGELIPGTRYRVVALIGSGGMGSVYEVEHVELGKRFVLKALLRSLTNRDDLVHRLRNEWRALGKLEHRNIVSVTDAGITTTGMPYFVMERLQGETLAVRLRRDRRIPICEAITIAADVLEGLSAAHRIGIVHRDVKPPNVFLVAKRPAKLLDFGIAKVLDPKASQITGRGIAIGTPRYMAPEQATGEAVDGRTDLYSVGLILFEMIAGSGPFDGSRDPNEVFLSHIAKTAPLLSSVAPFAPPALDPWLARLLAKKPEHRPDGAESVASALRALAAELKAPSWRPAPRDKDDPTLSGGPFDTLEAAHTVPSDGPPRIGGGATRTGIGPVRQALQDPWRPEEPQSGQTLRLDALTSGGDAPTRTAAPPPAPDTPPPVTETPFPALRNERRWARLSIAAVAIGALGAGAALSAQHAHRERGTEPAAAATARAAPAQQLVDESKPAAPGKLAPADSTTAVRAIGANSLASAPSVESTAASASASADTSGHEARTPGVTGAAGPLVVANPASSSSAGGNPSSSDLVARSMAHGSRSASKTRSSGGQGPNGPGLPSSGL